MATATHTHVVLRRFPGPNSKTLEPGTKVDASTWRTTQRLVDQRFLEQIREPLVAAPPAPPAGPPKAAAPVPPPNAGGNGGSNKKGA